MQEVAQTKNFLLVTIIPQQMTDEDALKDLKELKSLVEAYGGDVVDLVVQRREVHDRGMYIGRGKLEEVGKVIGDKEIDTVVLNARVNPGQTFEMKTLWMKQNPKIQVWDRIDLILEIFSAHATTAEAKLQIELAAMRHMGPRIYGMGMVMSRQGGGIGTLGVGETNTELMKRHWAAQMKKVQDKIKKHSQDRERQLAYRIRNGIETVSIIGYTNAGKTSLFNLLTGKKNVVNNALFVTLDSSTGKIFLPNTKKEVLLSDTIGFIRNLPTTLIDAFRSTLMESIHADVLLHVIDITDEQLHKKIAVVEGVLRELGIRHKKTIYVFNKIDMVEEKKRKEIEKEYQGFETQYLSVKTQKGIPQLLQAVEHLLQKKSSLDNPTLRPKRVHV